MAAGAVAPSDARRPDKWPTRKDLVDLRPPPRPQMRIDRLHEADRITVSADRPLPVVLMPGRGLSPETDPTHASHELKLLDDIRSVIAQMTLGR